VCTTVVHNTSQNSSDNFPSYPSDNHHSSDDVYWREGGYLETFSTKNNFPKSREWHCEVGLTSQTCAVSRRPYICYKCSDSSIAVHGKNMITYIGSTWTEHTSAKARVTSAVIWRISISSRFMSVKHFPYLLPNSDGSGKQLLYPDGDPDRHRNLIVCLLARCQPSWKFHANPFGSFCLSVSNFNRQTNDKNISSLAEVIM